MARLSLTDTFLEGIGRLPPDRVVDALENLHRKRREPPITTERQPVPFARLRQRTESYDELRSRLNEAERRQREESRVVDALIDQIRAAEPQRQHSIQQNALRLTATAAGMTGGRFAVRNAAKGVRAIELVRTRSSLDDVRVEISPTRLELEPEEQASVRFYVDLADARTARGDRVEFEIEARARDAILVTLFVEIDIVELRDGEPSK